VPEISIIFAAYREPGTIFDNMEKIARESDDVEFIISADEWKENDIKRAKALAKKYPLTLLHHEKRIGKVNGLNEAIAHSKGKIMVFLDNDVEITGAFIPGIIKAMQRGDVGQGIIHARGNGVIASGVKMDYLGINATIAVEEMTGIGFGVNGACTIAKREVVEKIGGFRHVITEDSDFGARASAAGFQPVLARDVHVTTDAPDNYVKWFRQRARWGVGTIQMGLLNRKYHEKHAVETVAQSLTAVPFILPFIIQMVAPGPIWAKIGYWIAAAFGAVNPVAPLAAAALYVILEVANPFVALANLILLGLWTWHWKNELKFNEITARDVIIYGTVYGPIWLAVLIGAAIYVLAKGPRIKKFMGWEA